MVLPVYRLENRSALKENSEKNKPQHSPFFQSRRPPFSWGWLVDVSGTCFCWWYTLSLSFWLVWFLFYKVLVCVSSGFVWMMFECSSPLRQTGMDSNPIKLCLGDLQWHWSLTDFRFFWDNKKEEEEEKEQGKKCAKPMFVQKRKYKIERENHQSAGKSCIPSASLFSWE